MLAQKRNFKRQSAAAGREQKPTLGRWRGGLTALSSPLSFLPFLSPQRLLLNRDLLWGRPSLRTTSSSSPNPIARNLSLSLEFSSCSFGTLWFFQCLKWENFMLLDRSPKDPFRCKLKSYEIDLIWFGLLSDITAEFGTDIDSVVLHGRKTVSHWMGFLLTNCDLGNIQTHPRRVNNWFFFSFFTPLSF